MLAVWAPPRGAAAAPDAGPERIPAVIVTDIGTDIDDSWAMALALRSPSSTSSSSSRIPSTRSTGRTVAAKFLESAGRADVPVGIGDNRGPTGDDNKTLAPWIAGYDSAKYPGRVYQDGVGALIDVVEKSPRPVTIVDIGPVHSLAIALEEGPGHRRQVPLRGDVREL